MNFDDKNIIFAIQKPDFVDTTSPTVIYEGYKSGVSYRICKIDMTTAIITRTWSDGQWADRANLTYTTE